MKTKNIFLLIVLFVLVLAGSCKKDTNTAPKETALYKIFENGVLTTEYIYSPQKKLIRQNFFDDSTGLLIFYFAYEYDAKSNPLREKQYSPANKLDYQKTYTWNGQEVEKSETQILYGTDSGKVTTRLKYSYDINGRLARYSWVDVLTDKIYQATNIVYHSNGSLKSRAMYSYNPLQELEAKTDYEASVISLPSNPYKFNVDPIRVQTAEFTASESHFHRYNGAAITLESKRIFSDRQFNNRNFVTKQTVITKKILPAGADEIIVYNYEYIEL